MKSIFKFGLIGLVLGFSAPAHAAPDAMIEGAKECTKHLPRYEREYAIPTHLLSAIASTESGRYHEGLKLKLPWPWTINAAGKGYFYSNKQEAIDAVKKFRAHGIQSIDVGCMQVNLLHHPEAFSSLDKAFEPENNIAYAAGFLRTLYNDGGTWKKAAADYHSKTPARGSQYVGLVYDSWFTIIERLRAARLRVPESAVAGMNDMKSASTLSPSSGYYQRGVKVVTSALPEQEGKRLASYKHPHMNSIKVRDESQVASAKPNRYASDMLVVKPEVVAVDSTPAPAPKASAIAVVAPAAVASALPAASAPVQPVTVASAQPVAPAPITAPASQPAQVTINAVPEAAITHLPASSAAALTSVPDPKLTRLSDRRPVQAASFTSNRKSGPNFIFND